MVNNKYIFSTLVLIPALLLGGCGGTSESVSGTDSNSDTNSSDNNSNAATTTYAISGTISSLPSGTSVVIQNNSGDDLTLTGDGSFSFSTTVDSGSSYQVTVKTQPSSTSTCNVVNGYGVASADVSNVAVSCVSGLFNVVDTNQSKCYDSNFGGEQTCVGTGYDADYDGNQPNYTVSDDGKMVYDNVTGLIWTQSTDTNGDGTVNVSDKMTQPNAVSYCSALTTGGHSWRLPSIKELYSLMDFTGGDPSGYSGSDTSALTPFLNAVFEPGFGDQSAGERIIDGQYATASFYVSPLGTIFGADTMFGVNFIDGRIKGYPYNYPSNNPKTFYVLCASGNSSYGTNDFSDNGDGTINDNAAGLLWQQDDYQSSNFEDAIAHCEAATTGGRSDWRLPNVKELQSILDYSRAPDYTNSAAIDPLFNATSITNEGGATDWGFYWASTTHTDYLGLGKNGAYVSFGRALGYFESALTDVHGAGAQRSNDKTDVATQGTVANLGYGNFYYHGPQGDILRLDNMVRCVTDI